MYKSVRTIHKRRHMAITRIDSARPASIQNQEQAQSVENQERVNLFEAEAFEKAPVINLQNGTTLRMPMGTGSEEAKSLTARLTKLDANQTNELMASVDTEAGHLEQNDSVSFF